MGFELTAEQTAIVDACRAGKSVVIEAGAGTGKTSTLKVAAQRMKGSGLYLAYNKAIQREAESTFPRQVTARTAHALAFQAVGKRYAARLSGPRQTGAAAARLLKITTPVEVADTRFQPAQIARLALGMVAKFCQSADDALTVRHLGPVSGLERDECLALAGELLPWARRAWEDLCRVDGVLKFAHDHYLKMWALSGPTLPFDYVLFDEAQDANPVIESVVKAQTGTQLVGVGDSAQQLYAWRGAEDALKRWQADERLFLSQSWRFGQGIAREANKWLELLDTKLRLTGAPGQHSVVGPITGSPDAVLCRTNAGAVGECLDALGAGKRVALVGGARQIISLAEAAQQLQSGQGTAHPELFVFSTWGAVQDYVDQDDEGQDLKAFVKLVDDHGADEIVSALAEVTDDTGKGPRPDLVVSTGHKAKGREWPRVRIGGDFKGPGNDRDGKPRRVPAADAMLAYVAVTRARQHLDRGGLDWIDDHVATPVPATTGEGGKSLSALTAGIVEPATEPVPSVSTKDAPKTVTEPAEEAVTCAGPDCDQPRPDDATRRWRFCSATCRQAAHRAAKTGTTRQGPDPAVLAKLDTQLGELVDGLTANLEYVRDAIGADPRALRSAPTLGLDTLVQQLQSIAIAHDRAAGASWADVAESLELHPDTARARYRDIAERSISRAQTVPCACCSAPTGARWCGRCQQCTPTSRVCGLASLAVVSTTVHSKRCGTESYSVPGEPADDLRMCLNSGCPVPLHSSVSATRKWDEIRVREALQW